MNPRFSILLVGVSRGVAIEHEIITAKPSRLLYIPPSPIALIDQLAGKSDALGGFHSINTDSMFLAGSDPAYTT